MSFWEWLLSPQNWMGLPKENDGLGTECVPHGITPGPKLHGQRHKHKCSQAAKHGARRFPKKQCPGGITRHQLPPDVSGQNCLN